MTADEDLDMTYGLGFGQVNWKVARAVVKAQDGGTVTWVTENGARIAAIVPAGWAEDHLRWAKAVRDHRPDTETAGQEPTS